MESVRLIWLIAEKYKNAIEMRYVVRRYRCVDFEERVIETTLCATGQVIRYVAFADGINYTAI